MIRRFGTLVVAFFALACVSAQAQDEDPWAEYTPAKLSEVIKALTSSDMQNQKGVDIGSRPLKTRVIYILAGRRRKESTGA